MKIEDLTDWDMSPEPTEGCEIECPKCEEYSSHTEWKEGVVLCDVCGEHACLVCPKCSSHFDSIEDKLFKVRNN